MRRVFMVGELLEGITVRVQVALHLLCLAAKVCYRIVGHAERSDKRFVGLRAAREDEG
jgi:hypothetical protein